MMDTAKLANNEISALLAWESRSRQSHSQMTAQAVFWRLSRTRDCGLAVPDTLLEEARNLGMRETAETLEVAEIWDADELADREQEILEDCPREDYDTASEWRDDVESMREELATEIKWDDKLLIVPVFKPDGEKLLFALPEKSGRRLGDFRFFFSGEVFVEYDLWGWASWPEDCVLLHAGQVSLLESQHVVCGGEVAGMAKQADDDADGIGSSKLRRLISNAGIGITDCYLCCTPIFSEEDAAIDHVLPSRWGGSNLVGNLAWSHRRCNIVKSAMLMCLDIPQRMEAEREGNYTGIFSPISASLSVDIVADVVSEVNVNMRRELSEAGVELVREDDGSIMLIAKESESSDARQSRSQ